MKRNLKSVFKFLALSGATVVITILLFRLVRSPVETGQGSIYVAGLHEALPVEPKVCPNYSLLSEAICTT